MKRLVNTSFLIFCLCITGFLSYKFIRFEFMKKAQSQVQPAQSVPDQQVEASGAEQMTNIPAAENSPMPPLPQPVNVLPSVTGQGDSSQSKTPQELDPHMKFVSNEGFVYDPIGRRDPFKAFIEISREQDLGVPAPSIVSGVTGSGSTIPSFLARQEGVSDTLIGVDVDAFKLVGILWDVNDPKAMLRSPSGKVFMVRLKSRVGRNNGYVAAIREGEVVVVELMNDAKTPATRILSLQK